MSNWKTVRLGDITKKIGSGATPTGGANNYKDCGISLIRSQNVLDLSFSKDGLAYIDEGQAKKLNNVIVEQGDILLNITGDSVARSCRVPENILPARVNQHVAIIRGEKGQLSNDFLLYYLQHIKMYLLSISGIGGTRNALTKKMIEDIMLNLPPIEEQQRIAGILGALDDKIECNNRINRNLEEQAAVLFRRWFVDFEFPDSNGNLYRTSGGTFIDSPLGEIPTGWKVVNLSDLCISVSKTHVKDKNELIFLNTSDIENGIFLHSSYSDVSAMPGQAKKSIVEGDILYSEIRPINSHFAYVNFPSSDYIVSTKLMVIRSVNINNRRLYQYLTCQSVVDILQHEAESRSGTFPQIRFDNIQQLSMVVAPNHIEKKYTKYLVSIYDQIDHNTKENRSLADLRDTLLPKLMNNEIKI